MKNVFLVLLFALCLVIIGCADVLEEEDEEDRDASTMCTELSGSSLSVHCVHNYLSSCEEDGAESLGEYGNWDTCYDDIQAVLDHYRNTGQIVDAPNAYGSDGSGGSGSGSSGNTDCYSAWKGDPNDVQVSTECMTACYYASIGSSEAASATCDIVRQWNAVSECPTCRQY